MLYLGPWLRRIRRRTQRNDLGQRLALESRPPLASPDRQKSLPAKRSNGLLGGSARSELNPWPEGIGEPRALAIVCSRGTPQDYPERSPAYTPPPPVFSWTGFYIGGNLGGAWARGTVSDSLFGLSASSDRSGFIGGGQLGVNYPATSFLAPSGTLTGHRSTRLGMAVLFPASELSRDRQTHGGYRRWPRGSAWCLAAERSFMARLAEGGSTIMPPLRT